MAANTACRRRKIHAIDTLAAGDVWHGAFTLMLGEGRPVADAARFANAAAALKCTRFGGRGGAPSRPEVEAMLARHKPLIHFKNNGLRSIDRSPWNVAWPV